MKKGFFPGTFNPPTLGHLDLIKKALKICDKLYIGIAFNQHKPSPLFSEKERLEFLKQMTKGLEHVEIVVFPGLVVEFVQENKIDFIIRGLRNGADLDYEAPQAIANLHMSGVETVFLLTSSNYSHISSSLVREIGSFGHRLDGFVAEEIEAQIFQKLYPKK